MEWVGEKKFPAKLYGMGLLPTGTAGRLGDCAARYCRWVNLMLLCGLMFHEPLVDLARVVFKAEERGCAHV
jgi:hypothetical protein